MKRVLSQASRMEEALQAGRRLILYHRDTDGVTSAALLLKFFPSDRIPLESPSIPDEVMRMIGEKKPDTIVFLDLAIHQDWARVGQLEKGARLVVIDHHLCDQDLASARTLYINPRSERRETYLSASYVVYHLLRALGKPMEQYAWMAGIGVIGDYAFTEGKDVLETIAGQNPLLVQQPVQQSRVGQAAQLISSAITMRGDAGAEQALRTLLAAEAFEDFEGSGPLQRMRRRVNEEIERVVDGFEERRELYPEQKAAFLELKSRLPISSAVSTILGERHPGLTVVIRRREGGGFKLSLRNQSGAVNLSDLVKSASAGIGTGGGHEKAAGAWVSDWELFRKRLLELLGETPA